jgi:RNA polymerase sigma factor (TIGR02999 family)
VSEFTLILQAMERGDASAAEKLFPLVYTELRNLAAQKMAHEAPGHTLQATALVHEAWLRLGGEEQPNWKSRAHFFGAAAEAMRRILISAARKRQAARRGGGAQDLDLADFDVPAEIGEDDDKLLAVDEAVQKFTAEDPQKAQLVKLRYFVGMTIEEAAEAMEISETTAKRWWAYARAWLLNELDPGS